jgi:hypothetical protein
MPNGLKLFSEQISSDKVRFLAKAGSTDERDAAYRAYVERVSSAWKDGRRPLPLSNFLVMRARSSGR